MTSKVLRFKALAFFLSALLFTSVLGQDSDQTSSKESGNQQSAAEKPVYCSAVHDVGQLTFGITNYGTFGRPPFRDCISGKLVPMTEFPKRSGTVHLYRAGLWVGAVVGRDTLVSTAIEANISSREFNPDVRPFGDIIYRTTADPSVPGFEEAVSEQDFIAVYTDTFTSGVPDLGFDAVDSRRHKPLGIEVTQSSYAWSFDYTEDFVLINYSIKNISDEILNDIYIGFYMDADVHQDEVSPRFNILGDLPIKPATDGLDDLGGFIENYPKEVNGCEITHPLNLAWTADNNGDSWGRDWFAPSVIGMRYLPIPSEEETLSFNWWLFSTSSLFDFGPQQRKNFRFMGNGYGTPIGDRNKYHLLRNGEIDYDQAYTASISPFDEKWVLPDPRLARAWGNANDIQWLISVGPYELGPDNKVDFPVAYLGGENFHLSAFTWQRDLAAHNDPDKFYTSLDFSDLANNAIWAGWVYDNPGVDTDDDGYSGEFEVCVLDSALDDTVWVPTLADTVYFTGDGVPDWRGAAPPPAPKIWVSRIVGGLRVRFNGQRSETTRDIFSGLLDFEGYNVYLGRDDRETSFSLVASYDREDYRKFVFNRDLKPQPGFEMEVGPPHSLRDLRCAYGKHPDPCNDTTFDPHQYSASNPYYHPFFSDSIFYFDRHGPNAADLGGPSSIRKIYPNQPPPSIPPVPSDYTNDGYLKYYEYEFTIENLLPTVSYYVNVTAFDFGSPEAGLAALETSKTLGAIEAFPGGSDDQLSGENDKIYVYPNPYRNDEDYRKSGYEGLARDILPRDKVRALHFANLPPQCTIRIFSIDGDLIRELTHDVSPSDPTSSHAQWDLINRNRQLVVSGLYYWSVEFPDGTTQIGKFAIIM